MAVGSARGEARTSLIALNVPSSADSFLAAEIQHGAKLAIND